MTRSNGMKFRPNHPIGHFTAWMKARLRVTLFWYNPSWFIMWMKLFLCEIVFFKNNFHNKAKKICIKTRSPSALLPSITVKRHISGLKHTLPTPRYGQYLTHAYNHITRAVAAMDSCFALIGAHQHGSREVKDPLLPRRVQISNPSVHGKR